MISKEFYKQVEAIAEQKELTIEEVLELMRKSLVNSYKKVFGNTSCRVSFNPKKNELLMFSVRKVVNEINDNVDDDIKQILLEDAIKEKGKTNIKPGQIIEIPVDLKALGRSGATAAKSVYNNNIKNLEREKSYNYFKERENEMINAQVLEIRDEYLILSVGRGITALLSKKELLKNDDPKVGDFLKVYIKKVEQTTKEPKVLLTRNDRNILSRILEHNIPEIASGIIEVKGIARDAGDRCKIAVYSNDVNVDAIGSCIGENGSRIKEIVNSLNGEKVDLYNWSTDIKETIANSLQPASVIKVLEVDEKNKSSIVIVPTDELSLAIGKLGQNVRLAVQSCGYKIDIKTLDQAKEEGLI